MTAGRALVLGTGGALGYAWTVAALSTWQQATGRDARDADVLIGTSAGSTVAAALAAGVAVDDLLDELLHPPARARSGSGRPAWPRPGIGSPALLGAVLARPWRHPPLALASALLPVGRGDTAALARGVRRRGLDDWPAAPRLRVVATDYDSGARVPFGRPGGPAVDPADAVAASCAVPGWFAPVRLGGRRYVDGGVCSATSADLLLGADLPACREALVLVPLGRRGAEWPAGPLAAVDGMARRLVGARSAREIARVRAAGVDVRAHAPGPEDRAVTGRNVMDARRQGEVARTALRTTAAWWARGEPA